MSAIDEQRFKALGREWTARFDFNAICEIEERRDGRAFLEIVAPMLQKIDASEAANPSRQLAAASALRFSDVRMILWQALLGAQPDTTEAETGEVIAEIGFGEAMRLVAWAIAKGLNSGQAEGDDVEPGNPKAAAKPKRR
jgi:hypothetical protein